MCVPIFSSFLKKVTAVIRPYQQSFVGKLGGCGKSVHASDDAPLYSYMLVESFTVTFA